ncbi:hypothetical protein RJT34_14397 [Clitoria ternatea]|uniref:Reverse transcriptase zinc-binding domain-containing protein n=1 Tax=Clitoria ternatea TaxID=43366 RepID=A0AAN9JQC2_CLITE
MLVALLQESHPLLPGAPQRQNRRSSSHQHHHLHVPPTQSTLQQEWWGNSGGEEDLKEHRVGGYGSVKEKTTQGQGEAPRIALQTPIRVATGEDTLSRPYTRHGDYTVKSGYRAIKLMTDVAEQAPSSSFSPRKSLWKAVWEAKVPKKIQTFVWKLCHNLLPVRSPSSHLEEMHSRRSLVVVVFRLSIASSPSPLRCSGRLLRFSGQPYDCCDCLFRRALGSFGCSKQAWALHASVSFILVYCCLYLLGP